jgi:two-component system nitrogen regulation response regulator NtrX
VTDETRNGWQDILIIDDEAPIQALIADILRDEGYAVRTVSSGPEAFAALAAQRPALVLLDVLMPVMPGEDVSAAIRRHDPTLPIMLISASSSRAMAMVKAGLAERFLAKPFELDDLLACVQRFLPSPAT